MFGTDAAAAALYSLVSVDADVLAFAGGTDRIVGLPLLPEGTKPPGVLIHPDPAAPNGTYDDRPIGSGILPWGETVDMVIRAIAAGASTDPIEAAAYAVLAAVDGKQTSITIRSRTYSVTTWAVGEIAGTYVILRDGTECRQLGIVVRCQINRVS